MEFIFSKYYPAPQVPCVFRFIFLRVSKLFIYDVTFSNPILFSSSASSTHLYITYDKSHLKIIITLICTFSLLTIKENVFFMLDVIFPDFDCRIKKFNISSSRTDWISNTLKNLDNRRIFIAPKLLIVYK